MHPYFSKTYIVLQVRPRAHCNGGEWTDSTRHGISMLAVYVRSKLLTERYPKVVSKVLASSD